MSRLSPDQLVRAAQEERDRRFAASRAAVHAGKLSAARASLDDRIWSAITSYLRGIAGQWGMSGPWSAEDKATMAASARATFKRALETLDGQAEHAPKIKALRDITYALEFTILYQRDRPWQAPS